MTTPEKPSQKKSQISSSTPGKANSTQKLQFMEEQWGQSEACGRKRGGEQFKGHFLIKKMFSNTS